jgi:hypothetical protein
MSAPDSDCRNRFLKRDSAFMRRRRRVWTILLGILASVIATLICAAWPGSSTFTVSTETTYVTRPLDKHGFVDYVTALNERLRGDITPKTNANVLIWKALGPHPDGRTMPDEYFQWLGIECPPEQGEYWVPWRNYVKDHLPDGNDRDANAKRELTVPSRPWTSRDDPHLADWLKLNDKPLALIIEATRRPEYYNPLVPKRTEDWSPGLLESFLPTVQRCREVAAALVSRALLRVAEGNIDDAWQDLLACHRLGRLIARGGTLIEMLVGIAMELITDGTDVSFLEHAKLSSKQILACWEDLRTIPPMATVADKINLTERFNFLDTIMLTARHGMPFLEGLSRDNAAPPKGNQFTARLFTQSINWDPALRNANGWFDRISAGLRIADRSSRLQEMSAIDKDLRSLKQASSNVGVIEKSLMGPKDRGEMIGDVLVSLTLPAFQKLQGSAERCEQAQRNLHLAFALAAFQRDHGRYPDKLDELARNYLEKIPDDLFSDKPLIYRLEAEGYLLYSVGLNGIDEDGRGDDVRVRVPVPEPRPKN